MGTRKALRWLLPLGVAAALVALALVLLAPADAVAGKGGGGPKPPKACCNPALEPGVGGNPFYFEGHTCCSDGKWRCNNPDATPSCAPGQVCP
jgi:hypothetical protein